MPVTLITGPHQSGKSRALWRRLRSEPHGSAVLVVPAQGLTHELVRAAHAWGGDGLMPPVMTLAELVERCAAGVGEGSATLSGGAAAHLMRGFCRDGLAGTRWEKLARFRAAPRELAELALRLDEHLIDDARLAACARDGSERLAEACAVAARARAFLAKRSGALGLATRGEQLRRMIAATPAVPWRALYFDDFMSLSPAERELIARLGQGRALVITAVDDARLGEGALAPKLRQRFPDAVEERFAAPSSAAGRAPALTRVLARALADDEPLDAEDAVARYHYRDEAHAARAVASWLRRHGVAPGHATLYVPAADADALALADGLIAAGVPVRGRFEVPWAGTAAGALALALGRWCARGDWDSFLDACERLTLAGVDAAPPLALSDLRRPWQRLPVAEAFARWRAIRVGGACEGWGWREPEKARPWLTATLAWLERAHERLAVDGAWHDRLRALAARLDLGDEASAAIARLDELARLEPVGVDELDEIARALRVRVTRGDALSEDRALIVADAVRGRTAPRRVAILHGLEHGRWPRPAVSGSLLPSGDRATLAAALAGDPYDEAGREAGEIAAFLAVLARGRERVVIGIPCGEREPSWWLSALAGQLGWDLEAERSQATFDAVPGAPLGAHDSQGGAERALWGAEQMRPRAVFAVPPGLHRQLRASQLNDVVDDSFALVCDLLALGPLGEDRRLRDEGDELHRLLRALAQHPPQDWAAVAGRALGQWAKAASDAIARAGRLMMARRATQAVRNEVTALADDGPPVASVAEQDIAITLDVPGHGALQLRGSIDRLDRLADGAVRVVDWKRGRVGNFSTLLRDGGEGQLLAYCHGLRQSGERIAAAWYRALTDGKHAGYGVGKIGVDDLDARVAHLAQQIARYAAGTAVAAEDGRCRRSPAYAAVARLDELRLDQSGDDDGDAS